MNKIFEKTKMESSKTVPNVLYRESTITLIRRIAEDADREALKVLINTRKLFRLKNQKPLLLHEFLLILRETSVLKYDYNKDIVDLADCCYDLTLAKYTNFPFRPKKGVNPNDYTLRGMGIDCRKYYLPFLRSMQRKIEQGMIRSQAQEELYAGKVLQNMVYRNFLLSKLECQRHTRFSIRYAWNVKGSVVYLWYPSHMTARRFREWLEDNIKNFDSNNPKEQERLQDLINRDFEWGYQIAMDSHDEFKASGMEMADPHLLLELHEDQVFVNKLAMDVAKKKVRNIHGLRPGIKKLGAKTIETMILRIFSDLSQGDYKAARIAELYGISKATLSRFAGNNWFEQKRDSDDFQIPDLWRNTAGILAGNPEYMEIVLASGVAAKLEKILEFIEPLNDKPNVG